MGWLDFVCCKQLSWKSIKSSQIWQSWLLELESLGGFFSSSSFSTVPAILHHEKWLWDSAISCSVTLNGFQVNRAGSSTPSFGYFFLFLFFLHNQTICALCDMYIPPAGTLNNKHRATRCNAQWNSPVCMLHHMIVWPIESNQGCAADSPRWSYTFPVRSLGAAVCQSNNLFPGPEKKSSALIGNLASASFSVHEERSYQSEHDAIAHSCPAVGCLIFCQTDWCGRDDKSVCVFVVFQFYFKTYPQTLQHQESD